MTRRNRTFLMKEVKERSIFLLVQRPWHKIHNKAFHETDLVQLLAERVLESTKRQRQSGLPKLMRMKNICTLPGFLHVLSFTMVRRFQYRSKSVTILSQSVSRTVKALRSTLPYLPLSVQLFSTKKKLLTASDQWHALLKFQ